MTRFDSFGRTVLFGAAAAVGWSLWMLLAAPLVGPAAARPIYLVAATAIYVGGLCRAAPQRLRMATATVVAAGIFAMLAQTTMSLAVGLAVILGVARSGFIHLAPAPRAVAREAMLLGSGLWLARFVTGAAMVPTAGALWAFFLVQGLLFLMPDSRADAAPAARADAFDVAYRRALSLLDERGV
jgi:hypothetical protein